MHLVSFLFASTKKAPTAPAKRNPRRAQPKQIVPESLVVTKPSCCHLLRNERCTPTPQALLSNEEISNLFADNCVLKKEDPRETYDVLRMLSSGSYGEVFFCKPKQQQKSKSSAEEEEKLVAKITSATKSRDMTEDEISILRIFAHENIVKLVDAYEHREGIWIFLEFMDGGDFRDISPRNVAWPTSVTVFAMSQILAALRYLHENNVAHLDIKPENLLWNTRGDVKLADFGLALPLSMENPLLTTMCGTRGYRAPEMLSRKPYNCAADIWSLGVTMLELLQGRYQRWDLRKTAAVAVAPMHSYPEFSHPTLSPRVQRVIMRMLTRCPEQRATAAELLCQEHEFFIACASSKPAFAEFAMTQRARAAQDRVEAMRACNKNHHASAAKRVAAVVL